MQVLICHEMDLIGLQRGVLITRINSAGRVSTQKGTWKPYGCFSNVTASSDAVDLQPMRVPSGKRRANIRWESNTRSQSATVESGLPLNTKNHSDILDE